MEYTCFNLINIYLITILQYQGHDTVLDLVHLLAHVKCHHEVRGIGNMWRTKNKLRSQKVTEGSKC